LFDARRTGYDTILISPRDAAADTVVRRMTGVTIRGKGVAAKVDQA